MKKFLFKTLLTLFTFAGLFLVGCSDDDDPITPTETKLYEFKVTNAGVNKDQIVAGEINETEKKVTLLVPFETEVEALMFEAKVSDGANITPSSGTIQDFSESRKFVVTSGLTTATYSVNVVKNDPTTTTLVNVGFIAETGTKYPTTINYKTKEITVNIFTGFPTIVKVDAIKVAPEMATYVVSNTNDDGYADISEPTTITIKEGAKEAVYTVKVNNVAIGFDLTNIKIGAFTGKEGAVPAQIADNNSRDAHMGNGTVYAPSRLNGNHVYFWEQANVFAGNVEPGELDLDGMIFDKSTWGISAVSVVGDRIYVSNMVNTADLQLKVWYFENKLAKAVEILNYTITSPVAPSSAVRLGDCFSVVTDDSGNGKIFFGNFPFNNVNNQFYVFDIASHKNVSATPSVINIDLEGGNIGQYGRINGIPGVKDKYLVTGAEMGIAVIDATGKIEQIVSTDVIQGRAQDVSIVNYNEARYLLYTVNREWEAGGTFGEIINISEGADVVEALKMLTPNNIEAKRVHQITIGAPDKADAWVSACTSANIINNELYVMNFSTLNGFAIQKFTPAR